jgi:hypothetical protein
MRVVSYILIAVGLLLFASAGYDQYRGVTRSPSAGRYTGYSHSTITRQSKPEEFHNAMTWHWFYACMLVIVGVIAYQIVRGQEKADPLSPEFAGNKELDDWSKAMDAEEKRKHPKP